MMMSVGSNVAYDNVLCSRAQLESYGASTTHRGVIHTVRLDEILQGGPQISVVKVHVEGL